jgi:hypothetical protein
MVRQTGWLRAAYIAAVLTGCGASAERSPAPPPIGDTPNGLNPSSRYATAARPTAASASPAGRPAAPNDEAHAATTQLSAARSVARAFFNSYVALLYGRLSPSRVGGADQRLRWQLQHERARTTSAERSSHPRVARLTLVAAGPPVSAIAVAIIAVGHGPKPRLTATLEPHHGMWLVTAIGG